MRTAYLETESPATVLNPALAYRTKRNYHEVCDETDMRWIVPRILLWLFVNIEAETA
jgi:hypothetical protein